MSKLSLFCRTATAFSRTGEVDEHAMRGYLARFIDARIGVVPGSSGSGEGFALSPAELKKVFEICVAECRGKIQVNGNPPEQHTAKATKELAQIAIDAKVDAVTLFPLAGWHGMKPTELELTGYYDDCLSAIKHPVALAINPIVGHSPKASLVADIIKRYPQIESAILVGMPDAYFVELKALVSRNIAWFAPLNGSLNWLNLGANGLYATEANLIPKTFRAYVDAYEKGDVEGVGRAYTAIKRVNAHTSKWTHSNVRIIKMFMRAFKLPGGEGGIREPYRIPPADEMKKFVDGLLALGIPEIDDQARAAGLK